MGQIVNPVPVSGTVLPVNQRIEHKMTVMLSSNADCAALRMPHRAPALRLRLQRYRRRQ